MRTNNAFLLEAAPDGILVVDVAVVAGVVCSCGGCEIIGIDEVALKSAKRRSRSATASLGLLLDVVVVVEFGIAEEVIEVVDDDVCCVTSDFGFDIIMVNKI